MIIKDNKQFNMFPSHVGLRKYIQYYNIVFPSKDVFTEHYMLMPNACGTLSLAFDGNTVIAELWGASLTPILLGTEPNTYNVLMPYRQVDSYRFASFACLKERHKNAAESVKGLKVC